MKKKITNFEIILFYIVPFLLLTSCSGQKSNKSIDTKMTLIQDTKFIKWVTGKDFTIWKPNQIDLNKVDELLNEAIEENKFYFLKTKKISELRKSYRQYLCYINEKGEKIIYINSMCELFTDYDEDNNPIPFDWKNKMVDISDGGECYWNIKINITTTKYYELRINGRS